MDKSAIEQITALAIQSNTLHLPEEVALIHQDFKLQSLERFKPGRDRLRGEYNTDLIGDFVNFISSHCEPCLWIPVFIDSEKPRATAILNYTESGAAGQFGHCDFQAHIELKLSAEMKAAIKLGNDRFEQQEAAEMLEDWANKLEFFDAEVKPIAPAQAINSIRKVQIEQVRRQESEVRHFGAERSEFEKIEASAQKMPCYIHFAVQPHPEMITRNYRYRVNILTSRSEPQFRFSQIGREQEEALLLNEFRAKVQTAINGASVIMDIADFEENTAPPAPRLSSMVKIFSGAFKP